jgi:hypothetical protein
MKFRRAVYIDTVQFPSSEFRQAAYFIGKYTYTTGDISTESNAALLGMHTYSCQHTASIKFTLSLALPSRQRK